MTPRCCDKIGLGIDHRREVTDRGLHSGADVDHESAAALTGAHEGVDGVVDIEQVACLAPITVDGHRLTVRKRSGPRCDDAVNWPLAGPVHRCHRERGVLHRVVVAVDREQVGDRPREHTAQSEW